MRIDQRVEQSHYEGIHPAIIASTLRMSKRDVCAMIDAISSRDRAHAERLETINNRSANALRSAGGYANLTPSTNEARRSVYMRGPRTCEGFDCSLSHMSPEHDNKPLTGGAHPGITEPPMIEAFGSPSESA